MKHYRQVKTSDRLPDDPQDRFVFLYEWDTLEVGSYSDGEWTVLEYDNPHVAAWLEEYATHTEDKLEQVGDMQMLIDEFVDIWTLPFSEENYDVISFREHLELLINE